MLDEHRFGQDGTHAAGPGEPSDIRQHMPKKNGQLAHRTILARSRNRQKRSGISNSPCTEPKPADLLGGLGELRLVEIEQLDLEAQRGTRRDIRR
jgi:hypothetical protein